MDVHEAELNQDILNQILEGVHGSIEGAVTTAQKPLLQEVISKGDDEYGSVMVAKVYQDAGVVPIYDIRTGQRSLCPVNLLPANLKKVDSEGKRMFTSRKPETVAPSSGLLKCMLHPDERPALFDTWGLPICEKPNIPDPLNLELHMKHYHPTSWAIIERERQRADKAEEREWQKQIAMAAVAGRAPEGDTGKKSKTA